MLMLVAAASSTNLKTRVLPLVIWRKLKLAVEATVYPNASGPGAIAASAKPGHNTQAASTVVNCPLLIVINLCCANVSTRPLNLYRIKTAGDVMSPAVLKSALRELL